MIFKIIQYTENLAGKCFELFNRKEIITPWPIFRDAFEEGVRKGDIYVEHDGVELISYARAWVENYNGTKVFRIADLASTGNYLAFYKEIALMQKEFFEYVVYYRKKTDSVYVALAWQPGNRAKLKRVMKGGEYGRSGLGRSCGSCELN